MITLHQYLDIFLQSEGTEEAIIKAKADYYRLYNTELQKRRRKSHKQITLTISKNLFKHLCRLSESAGMDVYLFIKQNLQGIDSGMSSVQLAQAKLLIRKLCEDLEEYVEQGLIPKIHLDEIERLESILLGE